MSKLLNKEKEFLLAFFYKSLLYFLYPFLNTLNKSKPYEYIRLTALGVIGALVKIDNREVIQYLLNTEIIPLCLRIMERGNELSKTVACFIVQRILLEENGLKYICEKSDRLNAINTVLSYMVKNKPSSKLVKHIALLNIASIQRTLAMLTPPQPVLRAQGLIRNSEAPAVPRR